MLTIIPLPTLSEQCPYGPCGSIKGRVERDYADDCDSKSTDGEQHRGFPRTLPALARLPIFESGFGFQRLGEIEALATGTAERRKRGGQLDRLDAFGCRRHPKRVGEAEDGT